LDIIRSRRFPLFAGAVLVVLLGAAFVLYGVSALGSKPGYERFAHGGLAYLHVLAQPPAQPEQALYDPQGEAHHLAEYRGHIVLVNLWATWCAPCLEELPTLGALQRRYQGRLSVVAVSADGAEDHDKAVSELRRLTGGSVAFLQDPTRNILFTGEVAPTTILYDRQGRERARVSGKADWSSPEANAFVDAALAREAHQAN
jgi:thiol-disulfide isomerase/thioredoxin